MSFTRINFEITSRCNLNCLHCLRDQVGDPRDLPVELIDRILGEARDHYNVTTSALTGGEPLMHPRFDEIVDALVRREFTFSFVTNGVLIPKKLPLLRKPEVKKQLLSVALSLDGPDAPTHDRVRGPGNFKKVMAAVVGLKAAGIPFVIKYTVGTHNLERLERAILDMSHLEAQRMEVTHMHPTPENLAAGLIATPEQWRAVEATVYRMGREIKMPVFMTSGVHSPQKFFSCTSLSMIDLYVDSRGRLCVCCQMPGIRGARPGEKEREVAASLTDTSLCEGHRRLLGIIHAFQRDRIDRIASGNLTETDRFECLACARYFGKLDWLAEQPDSPWATAFKK